VCCFDGHNATKGSYFKAQTLKNHASSLFMIHTATLEKSRNNLFFVDEFSFPTNAPPRRKWSFKD